MRVLKMTLALALGLTLIVPGMAPAATSTPTAAKAPAPLTLAAKRDLKQRVEEAKAKILAKNKRTPAPAPGGPSIKATGGVIDGLWIVKVDRDERADVAATVGALGGTVQKTARAGDGILVKLPSKTQSALAGKLRKTPGVTGVRQAVRFAATDFAPADPQYGSQWGLDRIGMPTAWSVATGSTDVTIAIVDTGVDLTHPDLVGHIDTENDKDFVSNKPSAQDDNGHGTHVAGIAAAQSNTTDGLGVAPNCTILPIKVLDRGGYGDDFTIAQGIEYAADKGAKVINMSFGGFTASQEIVDAVEYAQSKDVVLVAAAGNDGQSGFDGMGEGRVDYPGALPGVVTVSATTLNDTLAGWSSRGPEVDIAAPGANILSTRLGGGMTTMSGTSMASPFVAGAIALVRSVHPEYTAQQAIDAVTTTAEHRGAHAGKNVEFGAGRLNVAAALGTTGGTASAPSGPTDDDVIEGLTMPLVTPTATGTLDINYDQLDVFKVHLDAGKQLKATITAPARSRFSLYLFSPDTTSTSVYTATPINGDFEDGEESPTGPSSLTYTAPRDGDFYVAAITESGSGAYTLKSAITTAPVSDDSLPGVPLGASPVKGTLDDMGDLGDLYRVHLEKGERFAARLTGPKSAGGAYFVAVLYPSDIWSLNDSDYIDFAEWFWTPGMPADLGIESSGLSYVAPKTGDYYLDVRVEMGYGAYSLNWKKPTLGVDDEIPGVPLASATATGVLDQPFDNDDVYAIQATKGQRVNVALDSNPKGWFGVGVFGPDAQTVYPEEYSDPGPLAADYQALSFIAPEDGTYYIDVWSDAGTGPYRIRWSAKDEVTADLTTSIDTTHPAYTKPVSIDTTVTESGGTTPVVDQAVALEVYGGWGYWESVETTLTNSLGKARFKIATSSFLYLRVVTMKGFDADVLGDPLEVKPGVSVGAPKASASTLYRGRAANWSGIIKPPHVSRTQPVKLRFYRLISGKWVLNKEVATTISNPPTYYDDEDYFFGGTPPTYSNYTATGVKLMYSGRWRVTATHLEDDEHWSSSSSPVYVTVK